MALVHECTKTKSGPVERGHVQCSLRHSARISYRTGCSPCNYNQRKRQTLQTLTTPKSSSKALPSALGLISIISSSSSHMFAHSHLPLGHQCTRAVTSWKTQAGTVELKASNQTNDSLSDPFSDKACQVCLSLVEPSMAQSDIVSHDISTGNLEKSSIISPDKDFSP